MSLRWCRDLETELIDIQPETRLRVGYYDGAMIDTRKNARVSGGATSLRPCRPENATPQVLASLQHDDLQPVGARA